MLLYALYLFKYLLKYYINYKIVFFAEEVMENLFLYVAFFLLYPLFFSGHVNHSTAFSL